jgi:hypothetical protein
MKKISDEEILETYLKKVRPNMLEKAALTFGLYWTIYLIISDINENLTFLKALPLTLLLPSSLKHMWAIFSDDSLFTLFFRGGFAGEAIRKAYCPENSLLKIVYYVGWIAPLLCIPVNWYFKYR